MNIADKPLTVADLIRALSKLPPDAKILMYYVTETYPMTAKSFNDEGPVFVQKAGTTYENGMMYPMTPTETVLCFAYDDSRSGEPLDFGE